MNLLTSAFLYREAEAAPGRPNALGAMLILASVASLGGLLDQRRWARGLELARLLATAGLGVWLLPPVPAGILALAAPISAGLALSAQGNGHRLRPPRPRARPDPGPLQNLVDPFAGPGADGPRATIREKTAMRG